MTLFLIVLSDSVCEIKSYNHTLIVSLLVPKHNTAWMFTWMNNKMISLYNLCVSKTVPPQPDSDLARPISCHIHPHGIHILPYVNLFFRNDMCTLVVCLLNIACWPLLHVHASVLCSSGTPRNDTKRQHLLERLLDAVKQVDIFFSNTQILDVVNVIILWYRYSHPNSLLHVLSALEAVNLGEYMDMSLLYCSCIS